MVSLTRSTEVADDSGASRSVAPWIPVAWVVLLFVSSFRFTGQRSVNAAVSGSASIENAIELAVYAGIGFLAAVRLLWRTPRFAPFGVGAFFAFSLLSVASVLWSVIPLFTLIRSMQLVALAMLIAVTAGLWNEGVRQRDHDWTRVWLWYLGVAGVASIAAFLWPNWQKDRWSWPGLHTGTTAEYIAIAAMVLLSMWVEVGWRISPRFRRFVPFLFLVALTLLMLTITRSALFGFVAGAFLIVWTGSRLRADRRFAVVGGILAVAVAGLAWFSEALVEYLLRGQTVDQFYTFTGRTDLWAFALEQLNEAALLGFGYGSARVILIDEFFWAGTGHNLWIEAALSVGIIGAVLLTVVLAWMVFKALKFQRTEPGPSSSMALGFAAATLVSGFASTALALPGLNFAAAGIMLAALSSRQAARVPFADPGSDGGTLAVVGAGT
ncbi:MAG TPA: O-antigen ligase family protein [Acidimicrobiia bacterium]|nr:O-antigen ligase family protein [Acidimicrobiia bacterium]